MMHIFFIHNLTIVTLYISRRRADGRLLRWAVERDGNALALYFFIPYLHFFIVISLFLIFISLSLFLYLHFQETC